MIRQRGRGYVVTATILSRLSLWLYGLYATTQGALICVGGPGRWGGPSFQVVRQLPGSPYSWGVALATFGLTILTGSLLRRFWLKAVGLIGVVLWSFCFGVGAFAATLADPRAGTTGGPVYFAVGTAVLILLFVDEGQRS